MPSRRRAVIAALTLPVVAARESHAQTAATESPPAIAPLLFVVELRTGPKWDTSKKPGEQLHFRDHSANLKKLRDNGQLLVGARYSDKGWLVVGAETAAAARALIDADPSVQNGVFVYELHPVNVFYPGCIPGSRRS